jgi:hypothetical protein
MEIEMKAWVKLLPLIIVYVVVLVLSPTGIGRSDQTRYLWYAENLSKGYFSPKQPVNLWSGPGYPLLLAPFVALSLPLAVLRVLNIVLLFAGVCYFYAVLRTYLGARWATIGAYTLGLWPPIVMFVPRLLTETLAVLLVCGFTFHLSRIHRAEARTRTHLILASGYLAYLALTRVLYGYVALVLLVITLVLWLWKRQGALKRDMLVYCLALVFCLPYLGYTYSLTQKIFHWADSGGLSLYWMASPYEKDLGAWHDFTEVRRNPELKENHGSFFEELSGLSRTEQDEALKRKAVENIVNHPSKFLKNWGANVGRLLINYPFAYRSQNMFNYLRIIPGMFIVVFAIIVIHPTFAGRRRLPHEIWTLLLFGLVAFGGSSLLSAYNRLFLPLVPVVFLWIGVVLHKTVRVEILK